MSQELLSNQKKEIIDPDELDSKKNQRLFRELSCQDVQFFASHLTRPDGFIKMLITGKIVTSEELRDRLPSTFSKSHRGDYLGYTPGGHPLNDYLSFNVGIPQRMYSSSHPSIQDQAVGFGFITPIERILSRSDVGSGADMMGPLLRYGYATPRLDALKKSKGFEPALKGAVDFLEENPTPKYIESNLLVHVLHVSRMLGSLTAENPLEIHLYPSELGEPPRVNISEMVTLAPRRSRILIKKLLEEKLREIRELAPELKKLFSVDVMALDPEMILRGMNIYWYPQGTITEAIEYLSTHKTVWKKMAGKSA